MQITSQKGVIAMADIELVIKIPEDVYKRIVFYREFRDLNDCVTTIKALENGIPLPKGHGRLIDCSQLHLALDSFMYGINGIHKYIDDEQEVHTIIEADKEESEEI